MPWLLIYGANRFTGALIAREAVRRGLQPILAGRSKPSIESLGQELRLEGRVFGLDDVPAIEEGLKGVGVVLT